MVQRPRRALVVHGRDAARQEISTALASVGFVIAEASSFKAALEILTSEVDVLVTGVQLQEYNGLHLVYRAKQLRPDVAAVVISTTADAVLQRDAETLGATFVGHPVSERDLLVSILRTVHRDPRSTDPIRPPFERRSRERRQSTLAVAAEFERRVRGRRVRRLNADH